MENRVFYQKKTIQDADRTDMLLAKRGIVSAEKKIILPQCLPAQHFGRETAQNRTDHAFERILSLPGPFDNPLTDESIILVHFRIGIGQKAENGNQDQRRS